LEEKVPTFKGGGEGRNGKREGRGWEGGREEGRKGEVTGEEGGLAMYAFP